MRDAQAIGIHGDCAEILGSMASIGVPNFWSQLGCWEVGELYIYFTFLDVKGDRSLLMLVVAWPRNADN